MKESLTILKIGGNVLDNPETLSTVLSSFSSIAGSKILVHGGGKIANVYLKALGIEPNMVDGRRITDKDTIDVVTMVYAGLVNKKIVAQLQMLNCNAIGLSGADAALIPANKRPVQTIDYGYVGDVLSEYIGSKAISALLQSYMIPVFCPITYDVNKGYLLNTNADTIASSISVSMASIYNVRLIYCFEKNGVLSNPEDDNSVIDTITMSEYASYKDEGVISGGMIPKLDNAFSAIAKGVSEVLICGPNAFLKKNSIQGTLIVNEA